MSSDVLDRNKNSSHSPQTTSDLVFSVKLLQSILHVQSLLYKTECQSKRLNNTLANHLL